MESIKKYIQESGIIGKTFISEEGEEYTVKYIVEGSKYRINLGLSNGQVRSLGKSLDDRLKWNIQKNKI